MSSAGRLAVWIDLFKLSQATEMLMAAVVQENQAENVYSETYETLMQVSWNFDYQGQVAKRNALTITSE